MFASTALLTATAVNDPTLGSPGLAGFLATFALAVATWLLVRSMVGRLRKVRYGPGPVPPGGEPAGTGTGEAAARTAEDPPSDPGAAAATGADSTEHTG